MFFFSFSLQPLFPHPKRLEKRRGGGVSNRETRGGINIKKGKRENVQFELSKKKIQTSQKSPFFPFISSEFIIPLPKDVAGNPSHSPVSISIPPTLSVLPSPFPSHSIPISNTPTLEINRWLARRFLYRENFVGGGG